MAESNPSNNNILEMQHNLEEIQDIIAGFVQSYEKMDLDPFKLNSAYTEWMTALARNPQKIINDSLDFWHNSMQLTQQAMNSMLGGSFETVVEPLASDRRFRHEDWSEKPIFTAIQQSYLLTSQWLRQLVTDVDGLDEHTAEKVKFFTERYLDAMSPTNFALTNPAVMEKTCETNGANLVNGLKNMLSDLEDGDGQLRISMTDTDAFELGRNVAVTPGKVVFQNRMFQLLQYSPTTDKVLKQPLLIVPPWINKFYILDLQPKNSFLKWATDEGHTVFVISWVNPDASYADTHFASYIQEGVLTAVDAIEAATGEKQVNAIGYCIGGTLLATTLAYMKKLGDERIKSATFLTTMLDFSDPGELGVFIDEEQIGSLEKKMSDSGYLEGSSMAGAFNLMRANDLIWSFFVNNYLLGNDPRPFDLLYWNSDSTRMPSAMHSWYLRNLYMENKLVKPNALSMDSVGIDLGVVEVPAMFVSTIDDHIAPWMSTYQGATNFGGDVSFILGGSGHIAGIINPPSANKYGFRIGKDLPPTPDEWLKQSEEREGSWWDTWNDWAYKNSGGVLVAARAPGDGALPVIEDAPGTYVKCKIGEDVPVLPYTDLAAPATKKPAARKAVTKKLSPSPVIEKAAETAAPVKKIAAKKPALKKASEEIPEAKKAVAKISQTKKVAANSTGAKAARVTAKPVIDDLTKVKGIGPKLQETFNAEGIYSYAQLSAMSAEQIADLLIGLDPRNNRFKPADWPAQAKKLAKK